MIKRLGLKFFAVALAAASTSHLYAGNPQRVGSAGANELLINSWSRNSGWGNVNTAGVTGVESMFLNIAGIANIDGSEFAFSNTSWLVGSDVNLLSAGFVTKVKGNGALSLGITSINFGEWDVTTEAQPDGGIGTISPNSNVISVGYAQKFTESIYGGVNLKLFTMSLPNISVAAPAIDAGVQYITGSRKHVKFGITLRNIGPSVAFSGDGLGVVTSPPGQVYTMTMQSRSARFELPSALNIGFAYDWDLGGNQRLTGAANFQSNSFQKDEYGLGLEYAFRESFMFRSGYTFFDNRADGISTNALTGFNGGITFQLPSSGSGPGFGVDYSYRTTRAPFQGVHSIGFRITF